MCTHAHALSCKYTHHFASYNISISPILISTVSNWTSARERSGTYCSRLHSDLSDGMQILNSCSLTQPDRQNDMPVELRVGSLSSLHVVLNRWWSTCSSDLKAGCYKLKRLLIGQNLFYKQCIHGIELYQLQYIDLVRQRRMEKAGLRHAICCAGDVLDAAARVFCRVPRSNGWSD